jgi:hypothetical protein
VGIEPARHDLDLANIDIWKDPKPVVDMLQRLEFISNKDHFGVHFQGGVKRIDEADYYTIVEFKPPKGSVSIEPRKKEYTHSLIQGMLIELGNLLGYDTYSANQAPEYRDTTIGELATFDSLPEFTSKRILNTVRQIDAIWLEDESWDRIPSGGSLKRKPANHLSTNTAIGTSSALTKRLRDCTSKPSGSWPYEMSS